MKKIMLTFVLAIAGSVWTMSEAACYPQEPDNLALQYITVSGTIQYLGTPCEEGEVCPPCLTPAIVTSDKTYYLTTSNQAVQNFLEHMETSPVPSIYSLPLQAKASGTPFTRGYYNFLIVSDINSLYVQYFSDQLDLPSLCDEWNVLEFRSNMGGAPDEYNMRRYHLTTDTIIAGQRYIRLYRDNSYMGAMREGNNRDIYYIPAGTTHEYLLYAFNAQIGDELTDLWLGRTTNEVFTKEYFPYGVNATVEEITETTPRRFVLSTGYITTEEGVENYPYYFEWIEGIGFASAPDGADYPLPYAGGFTSFLLCAYKNGEQVYTSEMGQKYGCEYNSNAPISDTIPLFIKDGPGSSTVEPVDPNLIYATLTKDILSLYEKMDMEIGFTLYKATSANQVPAAKRTIKMTTFSDSISTVLTESGYYTIELTNPAWDYTIVGTFEYEMPQAVENADANTPAATKILRDGQLILLYKDRIYNVQGQQIQ